MSYRTIKFENELEVGAFKVFLNWKAIRHAHTNDPLSVTIRDMLTDQQFFELAVMYGKWK